MLHYVPGKDVPNMKAEIDTKVVCRDLDDIKGAVPETLYHSDVEIDRFQYTIRDYCGAQPIVVDRELNVIAGIGRLEAARLLGADEIPVLFIEAMSGNDVHDYMITMIQFAHFVGWTCDMIEKDLWCLKLLYLNKAF